GKDVAAAAGELAASLKRDRIDCAVSRWDASGLFTDMAAGGGVDRNVSIRTLSLVYAADLAFRLRWEIPPALEARGALAGTRGGSRGGRAAALDAFCAGSGLPRPRAGAQARQAVETAGRSRLCR